MMLIGNGRLVLGASVSYFGLDEPYYGNQHTLMKNVGGLSKLVAVPVGYGATGIQPCITAGAMASRPADAIVFSGSAPINMGISVSASGSILAFDGEAALGAVARMEASGSIEFLGSAGIYGVASMSATGSMDFSGSAGLGGLFSIEAAGPAFEFGGSAELHSLAWLETTENTGVMSEATIAAAVWSALAAQFNTAGTMGKAVNAAGTAGDPWTAILDGYAAGTAGAKLTALPSAGKLLALLEE
jgi:hypothetical protein